MVSAHFHFDEQTRNKQAESNNSSPSTPFRLTEVQKTEVIEIIKEYSMITDDGGNYLLFFRGKCNVSVPRPMEIGYCKLFAQASAMDDRRSTNVKTERRECRQLLYFLNFLLIVHFFNTLRNYIVCMMCDYNRTYRFDDYI